ncbi:hypothetical protein [Prosthecobacter sp.]|uniref:hypothetical protein n=1 Tax=Prosthecobacter sp. TaxID=1965333 RepID=UPI003783672A
MTKGRVVAGCFALSAVAICAVVGAWWLWVVLGHEARAVGRLVDAGAVARVNHCRLLGSTGYMRENDHVFECAPEDVRAADAGGMEWGRIDLADEHDAALFFRARRLMDRYVQPPVEWDQAEAWYGDPQGLLGMAFRVNAGGRCYLVLEVF